MSKFLSLNRPTRVSKLILNTPHHPDALPREIIPQWIDLLPSCKLPNRSCPLHEMSFSRGPLAHTIWEFPRSHGFDHHDPCLRIVRRSYHLLHDKYLQNFWTTALKKNLYQRGLINDEERVTCSLRELNQYRSFLYQQYRLKLLKKLHQIQVDNYDQFQTAKIQAHLRNIKDFSEKLSVVRKRAEIVFKNKIDRWNQGISDYKLQIEKIARDHENKKQLGISKGHLRDIENKYRYLQLLAQRKRSMLILKRQLRERDVSLRQRLLKNKHRKLEIRTRMNVERFRMHYMTYIKERNEKRQILETFLAQMQHKVQDRKDMYERKHKKLDEELVRRKARNLTRKYDRRSRAALVKALSKECKKGIWTKAAGRSPSMVQEVIERAINAAYAIHTTISPTTSSTQIIDTASQIVFDLRDVPNEPLPQDSLTKGYVMNRLREIMEQIVQTLVQSTCELIEQVALRKTESNNDDQTMRSSLSNQVSFVRMTGQTERCSRVSIGPVSIVAQYETDNYSLKKCKLRPPTPVTSVTSLVECTFGQPEEERSSTSKLEVSAESALNVIQRIHSDDYPLIHVMYSQRRFLEVNLLKYRKIVEPYVEQRVLAAIDLDHITIEGINDVSVGADERERILQRTASGLLSFPANDRLYADALFDSVNFLSAVVIKKIQHTLNVP
ncbi:uncharacterized protein LOC128721051 [Anopheles nili]|uniref:uncharacterized protein LOC128721051 n=1 Tax=Anopheles nili TaxID=185578 RepID=UPI00237BB9EF|nr:uncharacterized protein LOC128721051 [Anopheles nili]